MNPMGDIPRNGDGSLRKGGITDPKQKSDDCVSEPLWKQRGGDEEPVRCRERDLPRRCGCCRCPAHDFTPHNLCRLLLLLLSRSSSLHFVSDTIPHTKWLPLPPAAPGTAPSLLVRSSLLLVDGHAQSQVVRIADLDFDFPFPVFAFPFFDVVVQPPSPRSRRNSA